MNKIPAAIKSRLIMLSGCVVLVLIIGVFWSIVIRDAISLYLTIILVVLGVLKIYGLYRDAKDGQFNVLEGVLLSKYALTSRKEELRFICNGEEKPVIFAGKHGFTMGKAYRIYYQDRGEAEVDLPRVLRPCCILMGYEVIH